MASENEAANAAFEEAQQACRDGNHERAREIIGALSDEEVNDLLGISEDLQDGNPDEEIAAAIEELEPAAGEVAEAAIEAGRPDVAEEVIITTLSALADMAEAEQEIAEVIEEAAAEIEDEGAQEIASDAADAADLAEEAVQETLEEAGIPAEIADAETDPTIPGPDDYVEDIAPEPSHWLYRRRLGRRV